MEQGAAFGAKKTSYLMGPIYDKVFFLYSPIVAILVGVLLGKVQDYNINLFGFSITALILFYFILECMGDIGFIRCYLNPKVFKRFWIRLTFTPILLCVAVFSSLKWFLALLVLEIFIDIYHSCNQTFGIARFYDSKNKNQPNTARNYDYALNYAIYAGPIFLAGEAILGHFSYFSLFHEISDNSTIFSYLAQVPRLVYNHVDLIVNVSMFLVCTIVLAYIFKLKKLIDNKEYSLPNPKLILYLTTFACCFYVWNFESFIVAYVAVNTFHSWQYFGLNWMSERKNLKNILRLKNGRFNWLLVFAFFCGIGVLFGTFEQSANYMMDEVFEPKYAQDIPFEALMAMPWMWLVKLQVVSNLMHYYSDSFIWSVGHTDLKEKLS